MLIRRRKEKRGNTVFSDTPQIDRTRKIRPPLSEAEEIALRVETEGFVLLYSEVLKDLIAFAQEDFVDKVPPGFVVYSDSELRQLYGGKKPISDETLKLVHEAKKNGARVQAEADDSQRGAEVVSEIVEKSSAVPPVIWETGNVDQIRSLLALREAELIVAKAQLTDDEYIDLRIKDKILDLEIKIADLRRWLAEATQKENRQ